MNKMPEVYDDINILKEQLDSEKAILYCTAEVALWFVDQDYKKQLTLGEAIKISKWNGGLRIVPVKWNEDPETREYDYEKIITKHINNYSFIDVSVYLVLY